MECYPSRGKLLGLLGLSAIMVGASYSCTTLPGWTSRLFGWFGVAFFGLGFVAFPWQFFRTGPQVIIDDAGIRDRRSKLGVIPWEDVRSLGIISIQSTRLLAIELVDPESYLGKLPRWQRSLAAANRALGLPELAISFAGLTPGLDAAWAEIQSRAEVSHRAEGP